MQISTIQYFCSLQHEGLDLVSERQKTRLEMPIPAPSSYEMQKNKGGFLFCPKLSFLIKTFFVIEI